MTSEHTSIKTTTPVQKKSRVVASLKVAALSLFFFKEICSKNIKSTDVLALPAVVVKKKGAWGAFFSEQ